ncbi:MAG: Phosphoenolpyruvate synthase, partial [Candidatus Moranbacteria bacterium GW2011_GWF1_36_4]
MLGYRGAFRYIHDPDVFKLELCAIKKVQEKKGLNNLNLMIPFVRTIKELQEVKKIISHENLKRSHTFKLYMMTEIPSNIILIEDFIKTGIDGVSIGSNDLTMLILGIDRDNREVASEFDERNEAVMWAIERVIRACRKNNVSVSICGQAPSVYPGLIEKLVSYGIDSISVSPDAIDDTRRHIYLAEGKIVKIQTPKKFLLDGIFFGSPKAKNVIIFIHGLGSNLFSQAELAERLVDKNNSVLLFNNRGSGVLSRISQVDKKEKSGRKKHLIGMAKEVFTDCVDDIDGAVRFVESLGSKNILLIGHSTGTQKSVY